MAAPEIRILEPVPSPTELIDVAAQRPEVSGRLDRVGMSEIEVPVLLADPSGVPMRTPARADVFVSLDEPEAKGIHMSRLFLLLEEGLAKESLSLASLETLLHSFVDSHHPISESAYLDLRFDLAVRRPALLSGHSGWRSYPMRVHVSLEQGRFRARVGTRVTYSSTCPCSAALARQHVRERFLESFGNAAHAEVTEVADWLESPSGITATPHSQRSFAEVDVELRPGREADFVALIDRVEQALGTPVQAAVKRVDEQEFARLNGENPMFCEDAARRIHRALSSDPRIERFEAEVRHQESLHPHDAVSRVSGP